ncbi:ankyrin repeat domain-containing protein [Nostoc sp. FACHB-280]|uniref:ankyrin repeat domain-containing protein n=1 Tax=Nostoc sp. FACHB-280 TaxID=2692839 RepID=UPI00168B433A|nr:ankyrin repeat domain-containing protein [Nostoc sp. FACHB-280]MBD2494514.1 ankyrin repeat domain-containing protein [Nostoc sp. FACHB-280]
MSKFPERKYLTLHQLIESDDIQQIKLIVNSGMALESNDDKWGMTPLELAAHLNKITVVSLLVSSGVSANSISVSSPLHLAAANGSPEIISILINAGANVNFVHEDGWTPLFEAASRGHLKAVELLVKAGANTNVIDSYENKPISYAARNGYIEVVEYLATYTSVNEKEAAIKEAIEGAGAKARKKRERQQAH